VTARAAERKLIAVTVTAHSLVHVCELSFPALQVLVASELLGSQVAYQKIGFAYFVATLIFGAMALPAGFLVDRIGQRRVLLLFLFGAGLSMVLIGLSRNYLMLVVSLALMGGFIGLYHPAGVSLLSIGTTRHGNLMGMHGVGGNFGLAISPLLASALAAWLGWRAAFGVIGIFPIAFGLWALFDRKIGVSQNAGPEPALPENGPRPALILAPLLILFMMATLNGMCYRGLTTFLPAYFKQALPPGMIPGISSLVQAGSLTTAVLIVGMLSQFLGGRLADRLSKEKIFTAIFILAAPFLFMVSRSQGPAMVIYAMAFAFLYFANQPVSNAILPRYVPEPMRGRIYGWFFFMNFGAGSIMSWIAGIFADKFSLASIFALLAAIALLTGLLGFFLIRASTQAMKSAATQV